MAGAQGPAALPAAVLPVARMTYPDPTPYCPQSVSGDAVVTRSRLVRDLQSLGLCAGDIACVHSALGSLGLVVGGPRTVLEALIEVLGPEGTLMMPTFSGDLSDPAHWTTPAVPSDMVDTVRCELPGYDPILTPTRKMGVLPELFRHWPGTLRSSHPQSSFAARGAQSRELCGQHSLDFRFGEDSPLGRLIRLNGKVLILGAPWNTVSLFYFTEFAMPGRREIERQAPVSTPQGTVWKTYRDLDYPNLAHAAVIHLLEHSLARRGSVGGADSVLFSAPETIDATTVWRLSRP